MELSTGAKSWQTRGMSLRERIEFRIIRIPFMDCWLWDGHHDKDGYASIYVDKRTRQAHRVTYEEYIGPIPEGLQLDHTCRQRGCVNPRHVEPVTNIENQRRSPITMMMKTVCKRGHSDYRRSKGGKRRYCLTCKKMTNWGRNKISEAQGG